MALAGPEALPRGKLSRSPGLGRLSGAARRDQSRLTLNTKNLSFDIFIRKVSTICNKVRSQWKRLC